MRPAGSGRTTTRGTITFRWETLRRPAAAHLGEPVLASSPVSPVPRRAPGRGAWGHPPLAGAQVRFLVVTPTRVVVFGLDRGEPGQPYYRLLRVETAVDRAHVRGAELGPLRPVRRLTLVLAGQAPWRLEVSPSAARHWEPVVDELGRLDPGATTQVLSPDAPA